MHPDLKLGLVLLGAALLLHFGTPLRSALVVAADRLDLSSASFSWLVMVGGIGGLAVVAAAIWVDRRPPHPLMAAGAIVAALGLSVVGLSTSFAMAHLGAFVVGVGFSAIGSLIFYAIAVKGATRYKGTLIGALSMVFTMRQSAMDFLDWSDGITIIMFLASIALLLTGGALLFRFLPRAFAGSYVPRSTLQESLSTPGIRRSIAWLAAAFLVVYMVTSTFAVNFPFHTNESVSGANDFVLRLNTLSILSGIGALLWGIAADFFPGRRLLLLATLLLLPTTVALWAIDGSLALAIVFSASGLVRGGLICLPWVLMAELLPTQHFAKIALGITFVTGLLGSSTGILLWGLFQDVWDSEGVFIVVLVEALVLALVATRMPRPRAREQSVPTT